MFLTFLSLFSSLYSPSQDMDWMLDLANTNFQDAESFFDSSNTSSPSNSSYLGLPNGNVQDSAGNNNQAQTTESATYENPVVPPLVLDDPNPLPWSPNSSDPLANEALQDYSSSMVGLFSEGASYQFQNEDLQMLQDLGNQILNETSIHHSDTALLEHDPVEARAGIETGIRSEQFITNQRSVLYPLQNDQIITSPGTWNTSHASYSSYCPPSQFGTASYNSPASESSVSPRPMQAMGIRIEQVAPILANTIAPQRDRATTRESSSSKVQTLENVVIEDNSNGQNSSNEANSRQIPNTLYDPTFGKSRLYLTPISEHGKNQHERIIHIAFPSEKCVEFLVIG